MEIIFPGNKKAKAKPGEAFKAVAAKAKFSPNYGCGQWWKGMGDGDDTGRLWWSEINIKLTSLRADIGQFLILNVMSQRGRGGQVRLLRAQGL